MIYQLASRFEKDIEKLPTKREVWAVREIIAGIQEAQTLYDIKGIKKLSGHKTLYRIKTSRLGNHRVVLAYENSTVILLLLRVLHRKDIYNKISP